MISDRFRHKVTRYERNRAGGREPARGLARGGPARRRRGPATRRRARGRRRLRHVVLHRGRVRGARGSRPAWARPTRSRPRSSRPAAPTTRCSRSRGRARRPRCSTSSRSSASAFRPLRSRRSPSSPLARTAGRVVVLPFADERSVVQTRFATTALVLLRAHMGIDPAPAVAAAERVLELPLPIDPAGFDRFHFLGRGWTVGLAMRRRSSCARRPRRGARPTPRWSTGTGPIATADSRTLVIPIGRARPRPRIRRPRDRGDAPRPGGRAARLARARPPARDRARARPRPRPVKPPQPDTIGGAPMRRSLLLVAALAARPRRRLRRLGLRLVERRPGQHRAVARVRRRRGQGARRRREALQRNAFQDPRHRPELRQRRLRAAEGADGDPRWLLPRHRLPVRLVGREHGPHAQGGRRRSAHQGRPVDQLERLLARRAPGCDRGRTRSSASRRSSTTSPSSTTRSSSIRPAWPTRPPTGPGTTSARRPSA